MRRNMMRITGAVAVSAALALSAVACGDGDSDSGNGNEVTIGFMGDLTGENSGLVIPPKQGAQLAIEQYNATNPKVKIKFKTYDSQGKPEQATTLAQGAIKNDKIVGLIGPAFSGESQSVAPILEEAKVPSVSPSATNITLGEKGWKYWHRVVADDAVQSDGAANFLVNSVKAKKLFTVSDNQDYGKGLADAIGKAAGAKGVQTQTDAVDDKATDYSSTVNKINQFKPDAVYFGGYYAVAGRLFKQLREAGYKGKMMSGDGSLATGLIEGAGQANAQGALLSCGCLIDAEGKTNPKAKKFADDYKAKFNSEVAIYSTEGFDAATAFIEAVKAGKTEPEDINSFLKTEDIQGVGKQIKFAENGELAAKDIFIYEVKDNKLPLLGNSNEAKVS
ncbi:branched-chain amino acid transport system substrate-binding protein [Actinomadura coerulea]|uniref:Branched-chain amino acid transport system substrate-binding protein n=1 Tax=Actinomadura coerulea TaxID=46159 RepID=A0A7X0FVF8_9ACTN|nr:branched-chain amino acid ABC transporter substrate-binding protein [Actinomadura coerulea]MBB6393907.1 branched-chain amino acid transport system substrate-binding protein [Actinomadura coerulea]GGP89454.1 branched chain amino acid ABC transporter substrate-binding protein [Actinomadura coerulea]